MAIDPNAKSAKQGGLRYVCDTDAGLRRKRAGKGFAYVDVRGRAVRNKAALQRIRALAIPPAWTDVWICAHDDGHVQATGRDARGRKQYRYHARWAAVRGVEKFDRIIAFGNALPKLRRALRRDLVLDGLPREKVAAIVVALLGGTLVRVGNDEYADTNKSFGLTTLRNRHIEFLKGGRARIAFRGKSGKDHAIVLDDARLTRLVRHIQQLPGQQLFQYEGEDGTPQPVDSGTVNDYIRDAMGADFTAKDFRTWGGTISALRLLASQDVPVKKDGATNQRVANAIRNTVVERVASLLGNTPAVCRKSYIDPCLFTAWEDGRLHRTCANARGPRQWEQAGLRVLRMAHRDLAREKAA
ncbi:DNA topoisomerase IB (poxvirus type) [Lysobacter dokdonensis DS-58]|uniref:DNA topoisomerase n=1 Tax=Lysobacter dokdonensis DS-58 TaxID=1300345 RepID=A0A0A2WJE0_9GAMM|nr:DNA topoisomerase IB [Lysobacter dokdonensis]KGQ18837.1 DNA topoisomerase IB (poxvirus type) [Lysobacter dokdonensis DS-58]